MAIIIQEEKRNTGGLFSLGLTLIVLLIVGIAAYYLFFVDPELLTTTVAPIKLEVIDDMNALKFSPQDVVGSDFFQGKKQFIPLPTPAGGNQAPFGVL